MKIHEMDMCEGPITKKLLIFAIPLMFSSALQLLFNAADIAVVGRFVGEDALAAVGATSTIINMLVNLFVGLSVGVSVTLGHYYGAGQKKRAGYVVHTTMILSVLCGIILMLIGIVGADWILQWMNVPNEVIGQAALYLRIYFSGMIATMIYNFGSAVFRSVGETQKPLYYLATACVLNVALNLHFVLQWNMGVAGVALATSLSMWVSAVLVIVGMMREQGAIKLIPRQLFIHKSMLIRILKVGIPAGIQGTFLSLSNVIIQASINSFGATVVAGSSAASNIEGFVCVAMNSFHHACLTFMSQNLGAKKYKRIYPILIRSQICVTAVGILLGGLVIMFEHSLLGIYTTSEAVIAEGIKRLHYVAGPYFLCGMMDVMVGALRGLGASISPMIISLFGVCGMRLLWIALVLNIDKFYRIESIYLSYPISWGVTFLALVVCFAILIHHMQKQRGISLHG